MCLYLIIQHSGVNIQIIIIECKNSFEINSARIGNYGNIKVI